MRVASSGGARDAVMKVGIDLVPKHNIIQFGCRISNPQSASVMPDPRTNSALI